MNQYIVEARKAPHPNQRRVAIIQARMGSRRCPGKTMADINGKPLIWHIIERAKSSNVDEVVVATTDDPKDDEFCKYLTKIGIRSFRGPTPDLLRRYLEAAEASKADVISQIYGDSPCIDRDIMNRALKSLGNSFFCYTVGFPRGLNAYAFTIDRLRWAVKYCDTPEKREFHHQYMSRGGRTAICRWDVHGFSFTVDTLEDLEYIREAYRDLGDDFSYQQLVQWAMHKAVSAEPVNGRVRNL